MNEQLMAMMQQMGVLANPMDQMKGLFGLMEMMQGPQRADRELQLREQEYQLRDNAYQQDLEDRAMREEMDRARMLVHLASTTQGLVDPNAMQEMLGLAGFAGNLFLPQAAQQAAPTFAPGAENVMTADSEWLRQDMERQGLMGVVPQQ